MALLVAVMPLACGGDDPGGTGAEPLPEGVERVVSPTQGVWAPEEAWRLTEELRIGRVQGQGPDVWSSVGAMAVDSAGRMFVLDNETQEIRVFGPGGEHVRTFGREGEGPGEVTMGAALLLSPGGDLWVFDARGQRFTVFDTTGTYLRSHPVRSTRFLQGHRFAHDGTFLQFVGLERGGETEVVLVRGRVKPDGALAPVDTLSVPGLPSVDRTLLRSEQGGVPSIRMATLPFLPEPHRVLDPRGFVWTTAVDGSYRLIRHELGGGPDLVVERAYEPVPVTAEERAAALEPFEEADFDESRVPDVHPPFEELHVAGSGHLWVWRRAAAERVAWDVFGPAGRYLGELEPHLEDDGRFRLLTVTSDAVYGTWRDRLDVTYVVRLGLERPGGIERAVGGQPPGVRSRTSAEDRSAPRSARPRPLGSAPCCR